MHPISSANSGDRFRGTARGFGKTAHGESRTASSPVQRPRTDKRGEAWTIAWGDDAPVSNAPLSSSSPSSATFASASFASSPSFLAANAWGSLNRLMPIEDLATLVVDFCGWYDYLTFSRTCHGLRNHTPAVWKRLCQALSKDRALFLPSQYAPGWKQLFFRQLWPCRHKWTPTQATMAHDFKVRVAVRFRPAGVANSDAIQSMVLPLHQRALLVKQGLLDKRALFGHEAATDAQLIQALARDGGLPEDIFEALQEAARLDNATRAANHVVQDIRHVDGAAPPGPAVAIPPLVPAAMPAIVPAVVGGGGNGLEEAGGAVGGDTEAKGLEEEGGANGRQNEEEYEARQITTGARVVAVQPKQVMMYIRGVGVRPFTFSRVFSGDASQGDVYENCARDSVLSFLNGYNACLVCFGQTGSGKTHTIFGHGVESNAFETGSIDHQDGVAIRFLAETLSTLAQGREVRGKLSVQYVQIYQDQLTNLFTNQDVTLREGRGRDGTTDLWLQNCPEVDVESLEDARHVLRIGESAKRFASTKMNLRSSRAHTILIATLRQQRPGAVILSRLHLVDLAGCEQVKRSGVQGEQFVEAVGINSSLLVFGKVITALVEEHSHVPYLESTLTRILKQALGGNSRTTAIINCSPDEEHADATLHALRFGERCAQVKTRARVDAMTVTEAVTQIHQALASCERQMETMRANGREDGPAFALLKERYHLLKRKLGDIME